MTWKADQGSAWWEPHLVKSWAHQDHPDPFCAQPQPRGEGIRNRLSIESVRAAFPSPTPNVLQTLALWGCRPPCLQLMLVSPKLCYWGELWFGFYQPGWDPRGSVRHVPEPRPWPPSHPHPSHFTASAPIRPTERRATEGGQGKSPGCFVQPFCPTCSSGFTKCWHFKGCPEEERLECKPLYPLITMKTQPNEGHGRCLGRSSFTCMPWSLFQQ